VKPKRPILRYHGGKWRLANWIIGLMPPHRIYVEPFGGGGSVLMRKPKSYAEVYNDRWDVVVNVFRVLRDEAKAARLKTALKLTPFSRTEFMAVRSHSACDDVERARQTILRSFAGFGSAAINADFSTGFRANSHRSGTTPAHDWAHYPEQIEAFVDRLAGVCIENKDALQLIPQHDSPETLYFVDPPYVHSTRNMNRGNASYACEMSDADHQALAQVLKAARGMVMLCGYNCDIYRELYGEWEMVERVALADGARKRTECLWLNPAASAGRSQISFEAVTA
jgi:DNA adenine methylase